MKHCDHDDRIAALLIGAAVFVAVHILWWVRTGHFIVSFTGR